MSIPSYYWIPVTEACSSQASNPNTFQLEQMYKALHFTYTDFCTVVTLNDQTRLDFCRIEANEKLKVTYIRPGRSGHLHNSFLSCNRTCQQDSERCIWLLDWFVWGFYFKILFKSYMYLYEYLLGNVFVWVQVPSWVQEASNPLELLLQVTNHPHWALETKLRSFRNRVHAYNCWAISLVLAFFGKASK